LFVSRSRARTHLVVACALAAVLLTACGEPDGGADPGQPVDPGAPATDPADAHPTPDFDGQPPAELVVEPLAEPASADSRPAQPGDFVLVHYTGRSWSTGEVFDSSRNRQPFPFQLGVGQVIRGWDIGMVGLRVGEEVRLIIPPDLAYGEAGAAPVIGPNETLVFDLEILEIVPSDDVDQDEPTEDPDRVDGQQTDDTDEDS
jgi:peptidylprolyl isomerase